jgi:hypothetical protein
MLVYENMNEEERVFWVTQQSSAAVQLYGDVQLPATLRLQQSSKLITNMAKTMTA